MKCKNCNTINEEDSMFCKKCGSSLVEEEKKSKSKEKTNNKVKTKTKTKTKTKVVKEQVKDKNNKKANNTKKDVEVKVVEKKSTGKSIVIFFLILIILALLGVIGFFGYDYYKDNYEIKVPNLIGMDYDAAKDLVLSKNLKIEKIEKTSEDENVDKVIKQNKNVNSKVKKDTIIKVTVGIKDNRYKLPKFIDKDIDDVTDTLDNLGIKYEIQYNEDDCEDGVVLNQDPFSGERINKDSDTVALLVCKEYKQSDKDNSNEDDDESDENEEDE